MGAMPASFAPPITTGPSHRTDRRVPAMSFFIDRPEKSVHRVHRVQALFVPRSPSPRETKSGLSLPSESPVRLDRLEVRSEVRGRCSISFTKNQSRGLSDFKHGCDVYIKTRSLPEHAGSLYPRPQSFVPRPPSVSSTSGRWQCSPRPLPGQ